MKIEEMPKEILAQLLAEAICSVDSEDAETWNDEESSERCLITLDLPKGFADSAKKLFTEVCEGCDTRDCNRRDTTTNEFFDAIFHEGIRSLVSMQMQGASSAFMQKM